MLNVFPEIRDHVKVCHEFIFPKILDTDFEQMYKEGGRPPVSPRLLMCVTILQFLEKLPDRQTIQNLIFRLDWKIALELDLEYAGFSYQLLSVWRQRVVDHDEARKLMKTDEYKEEMKNRNAIEGTISALKRGYGFCRCRYRGKLNFRLQLYFTAISFNIKRLGLACGY
ncbi:MAG: transposase [Pseudomonadota bacterium]